MQKNSTFLFLYDNTGTQEQNFIESINIFSHSGKYKMVFDYLDSAKRKPGQETLRNILRHI